MSAISDILEWSQTTASVWMRDALRRIATNQQLSDEDLDELAELCRTPHGLAGNTKAANPISESDVPSAGDAGPVILASMTHISDVNALAPNETIQFAKAGITIVYGHNGAGKSGFARVLKRACRARGSGDPILVNALLDQPAGTPTARLTIAVAGADKEHTWKEGTAGFSELGAIGVFDSMAAQVYVADKTEVRFRPFGLDMLDKLAIACSQVRARLDAEKVKLESAAITLPAIPPDTQAGQLLSKLTALTKSVEVDRLATLTSAEKDDLRNAKTVLDTLRVEDPTKKSSELKLKVSRLKGVVAELETLEDLFSKTAIDAFAKLRAEAAEAQRLAEEAAKQLDHLSSFPGLGTPSWQMLWESARQYSGDCYPGRPFPHVEDGDKCVLCQQDLDSSARERLRRFEEFVCGELKVAAARKNGEIEVASKAYAQLVPGEKIAEALAELLVAAPDISAATTAFVEAARTCRESLLDGKMALQCLTVIAPLKEFNAFVVGIESQVAEMLKAADPAGKRALEIRYRELQARKDLATGRSQVVAEIDRKARLNAYEKCIRDTDTRVVTKLSTELTKKYVTDTLTLAFADELVRLGFNAPELELRPVGGQKGVLYHQIQLKNATRAALPKVLSEGEARCIALAGFLAEARGTGHASAIIFDDPVSSLDHRWRSNFAKRIVEEAGVRQVIVFTHELVFLSALLQDAEVKGIPCEIRSIERGSDRLPGHVSQDPPWCASDTRQRIGTLKAALQAAMNVYGTAGEKAYSPLAIAIYANMRQTWERAIEEVLFNGAVVRFRESIETNRLKKVGDICDADLAAIGAGMTKASKWEGGHDHALAVDDPVPPPIELKADIDALETWVKSVRGRRS
jgi:energy-coupling factor transporter ATP-binding protein EcfA2